MKPPSFAASAAACAVTISQSRNASVSSGVALAATIRSTSRSSSRISAAAVGGLVGLKSLAGLCFACICAWISNATALRSSSWLGGTVAERMVAIPSFEISIGPPGSAIVMATPTTNGARRTRSHSSSLKAALPVMPLLRAYAASPALYVAVRTTVLVRGWRARGRHVSQRESVGPPSAALRKILVPLALAQFICSFAGSNMNVMITDISTDLHTTVQGVQIAITLFLLVMAALMIPGGKLTDRWGRKRCFTIGLIVYGIGALMSAISPGLGVLILGNSIFEGVGTALLIPPVYILTTLLFSDMTSRARAFGIITGMGGVGAAAGPLIGGLITTAISWRAAFVFQALVIGVILWLSRGIVDPIEPDPSRPFDTLGAILSGAGLILVVMGVSAADNNLALMAILVAVGALVLTMFFVHIRARERRQ